MKSVVSFLFPGEMQADHSPLPAHPSGFLRLINHLEHVRYTRPGDTGSAIVQTFSGEAVFLGFFQSEFEIPVHLKLEARKDCCWFVFPIWADPCVNRKQHLNKQKMMYPILLICSVLLISLYSNCNNLRTTSANVESAPSSDNSGFQKLIVNEYGKKQNNYHSTVVSYNFREGIFVSKDTLFEKPGTLSVSLIHQGRYLISSVGPVFDMVTKKIIWESKSPHSFTEARGDTLFYKDGGTLPDHRIYYFLNLKTLHYTQVPKNGYKINYNTSGSNSTLCFSPDNKKVVYPVYIRTNLTEKKMPYAPTFNIVSRDRHTGDSAIIYNIYSPSSFNIEFSRVSIFWLDSSSFLFDHHPFFLNADHKGYHNIEIRKYDFNTGSDRLMCRIDSAERTNSNRGVFRRDAIGQLHYRANDGNNYLLDTVRNKASINPYFYLNTDFSFNTPLGKGATIRYQDSVIIQDILWPDPVARNDVIATTYRDPSTVSHHAPKGIKIWTSQLNDWTTFDVPWVRNIIGWMEE